MRCLVSVGVALSLALGATGCQLLAPFESTREDGGVAHDAPADAGDALVDGTAGEWVPPGGDPLWAHRVGHAGGVERLRFAVDSAGNVYGAGSFRGRIEIDGVELKSEGASDLLLVSWGADGTHRWTRAWGGVGDEDGRVIAVDDSGNVFVAGVFAESAAVGGDELTSAGQDDLFVASYSAADGDHRWSWGRGGLADDQLRGVAVGGGRVLITGGFTGAIGLGGGTMASAGQGDVFVAAYDAASGDHRWSAAYGGSFDDEGLGVATDETGDVFVTGRFQKEAGFGGGVLASAGGYDIFVASYAGDGGAHRWSKRFGGSDLDEGHAVAVGPAGDAYITGSFSGDVDFGAGIELGAGLQDIFVIRRGGVDGAHCWARAAGGAGVDVGRSIAVDADEGVYVAGSFAETATFEPGDTPLTSAGGDDAFWASYERHNGGFRWCRRLGGVGADAGESVAAQPAGESFVAGTFQKTITSAGGVELTASGGSDVFATSLDADGNERWLAPRTSSGPGGGTEVMAVAIDAAGRVLVTGSFTDRIDLGDTTLTSVDDHDIFVASYEATGELRWARAWGGAGRDDGMGIAVDASGDVFVTGRFAGTLDLGAVVSSQGEFDLFLAKLDGDDGDPRWSRVAGGPADDWGSDLAVDATGDLFVVGTFGDDVDLGGDPPLTSAGGADVFVASYDGASGAHRWSRGFGSSNWDAGPAIAVDDGGNVFITGFYYDASANLGGAVLPNAGYSDVFVASYEGVGGAHRWSAGYGAGGTDGGYGVAVDGEGNVFVAGSFQETVSFGGEPLTDAGHSDLFVASFENESGVHRWSVGFGGERGVYGADVAVDPGGDVFVAGRFTGAADLGGGVFDAALGFDAFAVSYGPDGGHRWSHAFGAGGTDRCRAIAAGTDLVVIAGRVSQRASFGGEPLYARRAGFVAAFTP